MGLAAQRLIRQLKDVSLPMREQEIAEICGKSVPYEVDWDSFEGDTDALNFVDNLSCHRLNMALRDICSDDLGRAAVCAGLHVVRLSRARDAGDMHLRFDEGVLDMRCAYQLRTDGMFDEGQIHAALMQKL